MNSISDLHALGDLLTDFVSKKDFKRKYEGEFLPPSPKKPRTVHSLDYSAYLARVATFKDISWCHSSTTSPLCPLSPLQLARYGWTGVEGEGRLARCISCRENLYLVLPPVTSPIFASTLAKQGARVATGHAEFCPWGASPSPHSWALVSSSKQEVLNMAKGLVLCGTDLPWVKEAQMNSFMLCIERLVSDMEKGECKRQEKRGRRKSREVELKSTKKVKETAALLALLGWQRGTVEDTMTDIFTVRRVGFWNFVSLQEKMDRVEDVKVARELSGQCGGEEDTPEIKDADGKKYFDPIKEHLSWNPLLVKEESGLCGWEVVKENWEKEEEVIVRNKEEKTIEGEQSAGCRRKSSSGEECDADTALHRVRSLLDMW